MVAAGVCTVDAGEFVVDVDAGGGWTPGLEPISSTVSADCAVGSSGRGIVTMR